MNIGLSIKCSNEWLAVFPTSFSLRVVVVLMILKTHLIKQKLRNILGKLMATAAFASFYDHKNMYGIS
jgi:hypothetical protein